VDRCTSTPGLACICIQVFPRRLRGRGTRHLLFSTSLGASWITLVIHSNSPSLSLHKAGLSERNTASNSRTLASDSFPVVIRNVCIVEIPHQQVLCLASSFSHWLSFRPLVSCDNEHLSRVVPGTTDPLETAIYCPWQLEMFTGNIASVPRRSCRKARRMSKVLAIHDGTSTRRNRHCAIWRAKRALPKGITDTSPSRSGPWHRGQGHVRCNGR